MLDGGIEQPADLLPCGASVFENVLVKLRVRQLKLKKREVVG